MVLNPFFVSGVSIADAETTEEVLYVATVDYSSRERVHDVLACIAHVAETKWYTE